MKLGRRRAGGQQWARVPFRKSVRCVFCTEKCEKEFRDFGCHTAVGDKNNSCVVCRIQTLLNVLVVTCCDHSTVLPIAMKGDTSVDSLGD